MLEKLFNVFREDAERDVPRLDMIIMTTLTTAIIIMPCIQYFIK